MPPSATRRAPNGAPRSGSPVFASVVPALTPPVPVAVVPLTPPVAVVPLTPPVPPAPPLAWALPALGALAVAAELPVLLVEPVLPAWALPALGAPVLPALLVEPETPPELPVLPLALPALPTEPVLPTLALPEDLALLAVLPVEAPVL